MIQGPDSFLVPDLVRLEYYAPVSVLIVSVWWISKTSLDKETGLFQCTNSIYSYSVLSYNSDVFSVSFYLVFIYKHLLRWTVRTLLFTIVRKTQLCSFTFTGIVHLRLKGNVWDPTVSFWWPSYVSRIASQPPFSVFCPKNLFTQTTKSVKFKINILYMWILFKKNDNGLK